MVNCFQVGSRYAKERDQTCAASKIRSLATSQAIFHLVNKLLQVLKCIMQGNR